MKRFVVGMALCGLVLAVVPSVHAAGWGRRASCSRTQYASCSRPQDASRARPQDIVDTAVAAGSFKTLAAALEAGGLIETLKGPGPFTVFAPTDEAFAKLPEGTVADLLKPENKATLVKILTYHVVPGRVPAAAVVKLSSAKTVEGSEVTIEAGSSGVRVNESNVVKTDIRASNGLIHVIDAVLLPE